MREVRSVLGTGVIGRAEVSAGDVVVELLAQAYGILVIVILPR